MLLKHQDVTEYHRRRQQKQIDTIVKIIENYDTRSWQLLPENPDYYYDNGMVPTYNMKAGAKRLNNALARCFKDIPKYGVIAPGAIEYIIIDRMRPVQEAVDMGASDTEGSHRIGYTIDKFFSDKFIRELSYE